MITHDADVLVEPIYERFWTTASPLVSIIIQFERDSVDIASARMPGVAVNRTPGTYGPKRYSRNLKVIR